MHQFRIAQAVQERRYPAATPGRRRLRMPIRLKRVRVTITIRLPEVSRS